MNNMNTQTCMNSNHLEVPIWCSKEPIDPKTSRNHGPLQTYEHACSISPWIQLKTHQFKHACMNYVLILHVWTKTWLNSTNDAWIMQESSLWQQQEDECPTLVLCSRFRCPIWQFALQFQAIQANSLEQFNSLPSSLSKAGWTRRTNEMFWFKHARAPMCYIEWATKGGNLVISPVHVI